MVAGCCPPEVAKPVIRPVAEAQDLRDLALPEEKHLKNLHQLTFGGDNAEAYWSFGGDRLIFQTNHAPYACDQIEVMPASGGPATRVSTGKGRTTCSYFLKGDQEIIYASTHDAAPACPTPPDMSKGYYWGLFEYDIYRANADGSNLRRLTETPGYDAEATVCPVDGSIVFTSMRSGDLELWRMNADGTNLRQLTNLPGYDGGAFFSADCSKIVWRASRPTGKDLEDYRALLAQKLVKPTKMDIWVANADGTDAHQVTYLPGASFAPYFFPDGKRIIFASNYLAPRGPEFDLFAIDLDGTHLERITYGPSFDGFPMFSPDGKRLAFSSNRRDVVREPAGDVYRITHGPAGAHDTNVFVADWVDHVDDASYQPETAAADRYAEDVRWLADDAREGRGIGTKGLADAGDYVQRQLEAAGAEVVRQPFDVTTAIEQVPNASSMIVDGKTVTGYVPTVYSASAAVEAPVVAVGWGLEDDYKGRDAKTKIALVHRFAPPDVKDPAQVAHDGDIRYKAFVARQHGAVGLIVVDDGDPKQDEAELPSLAPNGQLDPAAIGQHGDAGIPIVIAKREVIGKGIKKAKLAIQLVSRRTPTENVVGVIRAGAAQRQPGVVVVGAHLDHLGMGGGWNALDPKVHAVHNGADDNASGVAALLEVARALAANKQQLSRDVYVVAFSGEEEGDLGSDFFVKHLPAQPVVAMVNMDMVGRMRNDHLIVNGAESAKEWRALVEPACQAARVDCTIGGSGYGPSDQMSFYVAGIPVLFLFTGSHLDYHTATDDSDKINATGGTRAAQIASEVALAVANRGAPLTYVKSPPEPAGGDVRHVGASLGTVPSYSDDPNQPPGVTLSDVVPDGPAAKAGLHGGDRLVQVGSVEIRSINDLMFVLQTAKPGTETQLVYVRDGKRQTATATFGAPRGRR
jgi:Tol biopolymer transport system component/acetylornithine deacetylase/succinyl-diaminopimelate desuccinylase-like protein